MDINKQINGKYLTESREFYSLFLPLEKGWSVDFIFHIYVIYTETVALLLTFGISVLGYFLLQAECWKW